MSKCELVVLGPTWQQEGGDMLGLWIGVTVDPVGFPSGLDVGCKERECLQDIWPKKPQRQSKPFTDKN